MCLVSSRVAPLLAWRTPHVKTALHFFISSVPPHFPTTPRYFDTRTHEQVGYTGIACRCDYVFCSLHRYPEQHDCTFDFKTSDRNDLKRTVVGGGQFSKVDRL